LNLLSIASAVDLQYKNSKNQRLLVELSLLKMANIPATLNYLESEKKKALLVDKEILNLRPVQPTIVVKDSPKFERSQFKSTLNIKIVAEERKSKEIISEQTESADNQPSPIPEKLDLSGIGLLKAKEQYLFWAKNNLKLPISHWSLSIEEHIEDQTYYLSFSNDMIEEDFIKEKQDIIRFFKEHFNQLPSFRTSVSKVPAAEIKPYTNSEKFIFLAKKHPRLTELKNRLGLEAN